MQFAKIIQSKNNLTTVVNLALRFKVMSSKYIVNNKIVKILNMFSGDKPMKTSVLNMM